MSSTFFTVSILSSSVWFISFCSICLILLPTISQKAFTTLIRSISSRFSEAVMLVLTFAFPGAHHQASLALSFSSPLYKSHYCVLWGQYPNFFMKPTLVVHGSPPFIVKFSVSVPQKIAPKLFVHFLSTL